MDRSCTTGSVTMEAQESCDVPLVSKFSTPLLTHIFPLLFNMAKYLPISYSFKEQSSDHIYRTVTLFLIISSRKNEQGLRSEERVVSHYDE